MENYSPVLSHPDCNFLMKHSSFPRYVSPLPHLNSPSVGGIEHERIIQQLVGNFFIGEAKTNQNNFKTSLHFHIKNIENFPMIVSELGDGFYIVKSSSFDIPCLGQNFNYICH